MMRALSWIDVGPAELAVVLLLGTSAELPIGEHDEAGVRTTARRGVGGNVERLRLLAIRCGEGARKPAVLLIRGAEGQLAGEGGAPLGGAFGPTARKHGHGI